MKFKTLSEVLEENQVSKRVFAFAADTNEGNLSRNFDSDRWLVLANDDETFQIAKLGKRFKL